MDYKKNAERLMKENIGLRAKVARITNEADRLVIEKTVGAALAKFKAGLGYQLANEGLVRTALTQGIRVVRGDEGTRVVFMDDDGFEHINGDGSCQTAQDRLAALRADEEQAPLFAPVSDELMRPANYAELSTVEQLAIDRRILFAQMGAAKPIREGKKQGGDDKPQSPTKGDDLTPMERLKVERADMQAGA